MLLNKIIIIFFLIIITNNVYSLGGEKSLELKSIFQIQCKESKYNNNIKTATGFHIKNKGIFTALHAVYGCYSISARFYSTNHEYGKTNVLFDNLIVSQVDIKNDVALLESSKLRKYNTSLVPNSTITSSQELNITGYPIGLQTQITTKLLTNRAPYIKLIKLLRNDITERKKFIDRDSPSPTIDVINLNGIMMSGYSGAPILNKQDQVVGIGNGGLEIDHISIGIVWAIPWKNIKLSNFSEIRKTELDKLKVIIPNLYLSQMIDSTNRLLLKIELKSESESKIIYKEISATKSTEYLLTHSKYKINTYLIYKPKDKTKEILVQGKVGQQNISKNQQYEFSINQQGQDIFLKFSFPSYIIEDNIIRDNKRRLMWLSTGKTMSWNDAWEYVKKSHKGYHDWRLPTRSELQEIANYSKANKYFFKDDGQWFWSNQKTSGIDEAWLVNGGYAEIEYKEESLFKEGDTEIDKYHVRLIRSVN